MDDASVPFDLAPAVSPLDPFVPDEHTSSVSQPWVGRWNLLVSTTNWEKGAIISQWRESLRQQGLPASQFADETWAQLVGGVSGQHVGRLRRVHTRFAPLHGQFPALFWSHFQAALDWNDAEMWLEGAAQSSWSVSQMRRTRWESLGAIEAERPVEQDVVASEPEEDFTPAPNTFRDAFAGPLPEGPDFGDEDNERRGSAESRSSATNDENALTTRDAFVSAEGTPAAVRPFEHLPTLPDDVTEAFEQFKLVILRHKTSGWSEISREDLVATLESLKLLAVTGSEQGA